MYNFLKTGFKRMDLNKQSNPFISKAGSVSRITLQLTRAEVDGGDTAYTFPIRFSARITLSF